MSTKKENRKMRYLLVVGDGMADYPVPELDNMTPLQVAHKPNMDAIASKGRNGLLRTAHEGLSAGSDTAILSVLGYDPIRFYTGRGSLESYNNNAGIRGQDVGRLRLYF